MKSADEEIMTTLIGQVLLATYAAADFRPMASERDVVTLITRPMWEAFCRAAAIPPHSMPTEWKGVKSIRVFGSETKIVESDQWWSLSTPRR